MNILLLTCVYCCTTFIKPDLSRKYVFYKQQTGEPELPYVLKLLCIWNLDSRFPLSCYHKANRSQYSSHCFETSFG